MDGCPPKPFFPFTSSRNPSWNVLVSSFCLISRLPILSHSLSRGSESSLQATSLLCLSPSLVAPPLTHFPPSQPSAWFPSAPQKAQSEPSLFKLPLPHPLDRREPLHTRRSKGKGLSWIRQPRSPLIVDFPWGNTSGRDGRDTGDSTTTRGGESGAGDEATFSPQPEPSFRWSALFDLLTASYSVKPAKSAWVGEFWSLFCLLIPGCFRWIVFRVSETGYDFTVKWI